MSVYPESVQCLIGGWCNRGHRIGSGVGIALGESTVGRIGSESRSDYTAIGSVVNLASRVCSSAADRKFWWMPRRLNLWDRCASSYRPASPDEA
jgi:hypothetical protein